MSVCAQSLQRMTWPPRVAVRQFSIADITFNCSRLTRPTLALRHVGPCARKTSATSSAGRGTDAADQADFLRLLRGFACFVILVRFIDLGGVLSLVCRVGSTCRRDLARSTGFASFAPVPCVLGIRCSSGLVTFWMVLVATWV